MATSVALQLEKQFSTIPGLALISSANTLGSTSLTLEFEQGRDIDAAAVDVQAALLRAQRQLPQDMTQPPSYRKVNPADAPVLFIALTSPSLSLSDLNDFAEHLISPTLSTLDGVAQVNIFGQKRFAVRVRVLPDALAARNITLDELTAALRAANANTPVGTLEGPQQTLTLQANKQLRNAAEFAELIVSNRNGNPVRLRDVARVEDSFETVKTTATFNGESSISLAVLRQPDANTVKVVDAVRAALPEFRQQLPQSVRISIGNDRSVSIRDALHDVTLTMLGTIVLVVLVIFLFLRRFVATVIPTLSLPVSLVGAISLLWAFGYTLDNISLLGITLAVGLVVDDAIVMLENIMRHVEDGEPPFQAALRGSREVGFTIISISSSLVAVFIPIFFMPGVIGLLFHEFAVIVSLAIVASAFVSLTLVPMLASRFLTDEAHKKRPGAIVRAFERGFDAMLGAYTPHARRGAAPSPHGPGRRAGDLGRDLVAVRDHPQGLLPGRGHRPDPDHHRGVGGHLVPGDGAAAGAARRHPAQRPERGDGQLLQRRPGLAEHRPHVPQPEAARRAPADEGGGRGPAPQVPRGARHPGLHAADPEPAARRPRQSKAQYQYILQSVKADELNDWAVKLQEPLRADPMFRDVTSDSQLRGLQASLKIDRDRANTLGVSIDGIRTALFSAFGERQVSTIYTAVDSYQVIMEVAPGAKQDESAFNNIYVRSSDRRRWCRCRASRRWSARSGRPRSTTSGQLQAVTVSFNLAPGRARSATPRRRSSSTASRSACRRRSSRATAATRRCSRARRAARRS